MVFELGVEVVLFDNMCGEIFVEVVCCCKGCIVIEVLGGIDFEVGLIVV